MIVFFSTNIPGLFGIFKTHSLEYVNLYENPLNTSTFTKDNYTAAILNEENYGLGNVTIDDLHFIYYVKGIYNQNVVYPLHAVDIETNALVVDTEKQEYINTSRAATKETPLSPKIDTILVRINETLQITYNNPTTGYLIYHSRFASALLEEFYVYDGISVTKLTAETDYTIDNQFFVIFYYEDFFQKGPIFNFTIYFTWQVEFILADWLVFQEENNPLIMEEVEQEFSPKFVYNFYLISWGVNPDNTGTIPINFIEVALTINPPDKDSLSNHEMFVNILDVDINNYLQPDNSLKIEISDSFMPNRSFIILNFTSTFNLKIEEPVGQTWAIDRLVAERNIRERIYFISLISGPKSIVLNYIEFFEPDIYIDEVIEASSLFNREVEYVDANASIPRQLGLMVKIPYLLVEETNPILIKYIASHVLNGVITDNIKMPLVGAIVEIFLLGVKYGTYISNATVQPIDPGRTDESGKFELHNVPRGNYTLRVFWEGNVVKEVIITTDREVNYVFTSVPHFPLWIIIFGMTSGIILVVGTLFYRKNKKFR